MSEVLTRWEMFFGAYWDVDKKTAMAAMKLCVYNISVHLTIIIMMISMMIIFILIILG